MTSSYKPRISYYYDSDVGSFHYGTGALKNKARHAAYPHLAPSITHTLNAPTPYPSPP